MIGERKKAKEYDRKELVLLGWHVVKGAGVCQSPLQCHIRQPDIMQRAQFQDRLRHGSALLTITVLLAAHVADRKSVV